MVESHPGEETSKKRVSSSSLFGAIVLISIGVFFLLYNFDLIPGPDWEVLLLFWPVLLIFAGLNILTLGIPRPWGTILSGLLAVGVVLFFAWLLFFGGSDWVIQKFDLPGIEDTFFDFFP